MFDSEYEEDSQAVPWKLSKKESFLSFTEWKTTLLQFLENEPVFAPFLTPELKWEMASSSIPNRGFQDDGMILPDTSAEQKNTILNLMLQRIAVYCPVINHHYIINRTTCLDDIWDTVIVHFGFYLEEVCESNNVVAESSVPGVTAHRIITDNISDYCSPDYNRSQFYCDSQRDIYDDTDIRGDIGLADGGFGDYDEDAYSNYDTDDDSEHDDDLCNSDKESRDVSYEVDVCNSDCCDRVSDIDARMQYEIAAIYATIAADEAETEVLANSIPQAAMHMAICNRQAAVNTISDRKITTSPDVTQSLQVDTEQPSNQSSISLSSQQADVMDEPVIERGMITTSAAVTMGSVGDEVLQHSSQCHNKISSSRDPNPHVLTMAGKERDLPLLQSDIAQQDEQTSNSSLCTLRDSHEQNDHIMDTHGMQCEMATTYAKYHCQSSVTQCSLLCDEDDPAIEISLHHDHTCKLSGDLDNILEDCPVPDVAQDSRNDERCVAEAASLSSHMWRDYTQHTCSPSSQSSADNKEKSPIASAFQCSYESVGKGVPENIAPIGTNCSSWIYCLDSMDRGPKDLVLVEGKIITSQMPVCSHTQSVLYSDDGDRGKDNPNPGQSVLLDQTFKVDCGSTTDPQHDSILHQYDINTVVTPVYVDQPQDPHVSISPTFNLQQDNMYIESSRMSAMIKVVNPTSESSCQDVNDSMVHRVSSEKLQRTHAYDGLACHNMAIPGRHLAWLVVAPSDRPPPLMS